VAIELGLRERKKQQTRQLIAGSASRLFNARGFESVKVAEIARAADVSEVTVFNYFPTKEDLFFSGMESFEEILLEAVRDRAPGESALAAIRHTVLEGCKGLGTEERADAIADAATLINASPALQTREREIVARYAQRLAALLAAEAGARADDLEACAVAGALMSTQRALVVYVRGRVLAGRRGSKLVRDARSQVSRAFALLENGLARYAVRKR
jgi:AcrR family transcriptional regulator